GPSLTGRADRFVLFQAGKTSDGKRKPASAKTASSSRVSIEEGLIRIRAGGQSTAFEPTGRAPMGTDGASEEAGALPLDRRGLSITSVGTANFSSSEVMNFLAEEFMVYSSNQTAVYSPGGIFIAGSVPPNGDTVETTRTVQPRRGMQKLRGHILMAPGAGSGV
ncbi:unnamed protein product, partial [Sphacelaria rigidula]